MKAFEKYYQNQAGKSLTDNEAKNMLLAAGYQRTDKLAGSGPVANQTASNYLTQFAPSSLFSTTPEDYANPGILTGPMTPERAALGGIGFGTATVQFGLNASGHLFSVGGGGEVGAAISLGGHPNLCVYGQACGNYGLGMYAGAGGVVTISQGGATTGISGSKGGFISGGDGIAGDTTITRDPSGNVSGGKGVFGVGIGGAAGVTQCKQASACISGN